MKPLLSKKQIREKIDNYIYSLVKKSTNDQVAEVLIEISEFVVKNQNDFKYGVHEYNSKQESELNPYYMARINALTEENITLKKLLKESL